MPIVQSNHTFNYDDTVSFNTNFSIWFMENSEERSAWGDKPYSREEGLEVFTNLFEKKVDNI